MLTTILNLNKRVLVVDPPELADCEVFKHGIYFNLDSGDRDFIEGKFQFLCKGEDLTEEIAATFIKIEDFGLYQNHRIKDVKFCERCSALDSFISAIEASGHYWLVNPLQSTPPIEDVSFYDDGESYLIAIKQWNLAESSTFKNPLIFEVL